ncbi:MAG: NAD-dependent succinate-semialdehyde dehydrogenase [Dermatophilaceae bacterium]
MTVSAADLLRDVPTQLLLDGGWRAGSDGGVFDVTNPATGESLAVVASATVDDAEAAVAAAARAQAGWAATAPRERGEILRGAFEDIVARAEEFALLMTLEMGKPLADSRAEVSYGAEFFRWFSEEAVRVHGRYAFSPDGSTRLLTLKQPVGPTLMITPWNFPLAMGTRKIGPAIAAGCTMIVKPASHTPLTMLALGKLLQDRGLPPGVLNILPSRDTGAITQRMLGDARLRKVTFTGSTAVGRTLVKQSAHRLLRVSMELGGNAPFIVFSDADVDAAVAGAMVAKMRNMGEACTAANRILVHEYVADEFTAKLAAAMGALTVGDGTAEGVQVGPLVDTAVREKIEELVGDALTRGARCLTGGMRLDRVGAFYEPTVLAGVPADARIMSEEVFGPVAPVVTFTDDEEAVRIANDTEYGLASYVFTRDLSRALRVVEALDYGMVGINQGVISNPAAPFGGVKASGFGREGGVEGIEEYLEIKYVGIRP